MTPYFITATGTGIGKTLVTCSLAYQCLQKGTSIRTLKPLISGWEEEESDTANLLRSQGLPVTQAAIEATSPWRFHPPLSPDMAALREGRTVNFAEVVSFCQKPYTEDILLIEGAGGLMTPLNSTHTMLDLIVALRAIPILVTGSYLGSLSHTLTALAALEARKLCAHALIVSESDTADVPFTDTLSSLAQFTQVPLIPLPRLRENGERPWEEAPDLMEALQHIPQHRL